MFLGKRNYLNPEKRTKLSAKDKVYQVAVLLETDNVKLFGAFCMEVSEKIPEEIWLPSVN